MASATPAEQLASACSCRCWLGLQAYKQYNMVTVKPALYHSIFIQCILLKCTAPTRPHVAFFVQHRPLQSRGSTPTSLCRIGCILLRCTCRRLRGLYGGGGVIVRVAGMRLLGCQAFRVCKSIRSGVQHSLVTLQH